MILQLQAQHLDPFPRYSEVLSKSSLDNKMTKLFNCGKALVKKSSNLASVTKPLDNLYIWREQLSAPWRKKVALFLVFF